MTPHAVPSIHEYREIKEQLMAIADSITALTDSVNRIEAKVTSLEADVAANSQAATDLANADAQIQALTAQINSAIPPA